MTSDEWRVGDQQIDRMLAKADSRLREVLAERDSRRAPSIVDVFHSIATAHANRSIASTGDRSVDALLADANSALEQIVASSSATRTAAQEQTNAAIAGAIPDGAGPFDMESLKRVVELLVARGDDEGAIAVLRLGAVASANRAAVEGRGRESTARHRHAATPRGSQLPEQMWSDASDGSADRVAEEFPARDADTDPSRLQGNLDTRPVESTPIFEEIASAWYRQYRSVPVSWESDIRPQPTAAARSPRLSPSAEPSPSGTAMPSDDPAARTTFDHADAQVTRVPEPSPVDFFTGADEGWIAASEAVAERRDELTAAGLPKGRHRAPLIPGSAGSAAVAPAVTGARSPESIRGRLATYQQGVREGRETRR